MTNGSESSIEVRFETFVDYDYLYHSHPSGFCLPSGQDLEVLYIMNFRVIIIQLGCRLVKLNGNMFLWEMIIQLIIQSAIISKIIGYEKDYI